LKSEEQSQLTSSGVLMSLLLKKLNEIKEKMTYVACPACKEEWTKLCPCRVWGDTEGNEKVFHMEYLCVTCAESLRSFNWIVSQWPQNVFDNYPRPKVEIVWMKKQPIYSICYGEKAYHWKNMIGKVWLANPRAEKEGPEYLIRYESNRFVIYVAGQDEPLYSPNAIDAWFKIILHLKNPDLKNTEGPSE